MIIEEQFITVVRSKVFLDWVEHSKLITDKKNFKNKLVSEDIYLFSLFIMDGKFELFFYNKEDKGSMIFTRNLKDESISARNEEHNTLYDEMHSMKATKDPEPLVYDNIKISYEEAMNISKGFVDKGMPIIGHPIISIQAVEGKTIFDVILFQQNFEVLIAKIDATTKKVIETRKNKFGIQDILPGNKDKPEKEEKKPKVTKKKPHKD